MPGTISGFPVLTKPAGRRQRVVGGLACRHTRPMLRSDFQQLAAVRIRDAKALLVAGQFDGSYYVGGFVVEAALKACIAKATLRFEFPDKNRANAVFTHDLIKLLNEADLGLLMRAESMNIRTKWSLVSKWKVDVRYSVGKSRSEAEDFISAIMGRGGIMSWVKRYW